MRAADIHCVSHRRKRRHRPDTATHDDLVKRQFTADGPDRVWFTDITQHRASDAWVYCCAVMDAWSRRVVGWAIADHVRSELVVDALEMARWQRSPAGTIVHADRGPPIHLLGIWSSAASSRPAGIDGARCLQRRQRAHRIVLVHHATRTPRPPALGFPNRTRLGDLRMDRRLVQPPPTALDPGSAVTTRIRNTEHRRRKSGKITKPKLSELRG